MKLQTIAFLILAVTSQAPAQDTAKSRRRKIRMRKHQMAAWHRVADVDEIPDDSARELVAGGRVVALYRVNGEFHALDGVCPHAGGPLGEGTLNGCIVTCPWHGWQFDVTSGQHCLNENLQHTRFDVKVEGDGLFVEIPE